MLGAIGLSSTKMLEINQLTYSFNQNDRPIFQSLSMLVESGEFVSLIGPSGSGKSTLFKLITGLIEPNQGEIRIQGNIQDSRRLGNVGYMPQTDLLLPWKTVLENVMLPIEINRGNRQEKLPEIREWLKRFGLADYEKAYPNELSGGMRQRTAFLRTIMTGGNLILLDEPFGALDSLTKRNMQAWLLGLWAELRKTVLFITHDLEEALLLSDRIYLIRADGSGVVEVKVSLTRPRSSELVFQPEFLAMRKELESLIHHEN